MAACPTKVRHFMFDQCKLQEMCSSTHLDSANCKGRTMILKGLVFTGHKSFQVKASPGTCASWRYKNVMWSIAAIPERAFCADAAFLASVEPQIRHCSWFTAGPGVTSLCTRAASTTLVDSLHALHCLATIADPSITDWSIKLAERCSVGSPRMQVSHRALTSLDVQATKDSTTRVLGTSSVKVDLFALLDRCASEGGRQLLKKQLQQPMASFQRLSEWAQESAWICDVFGPSEFQQQRERSGGTLIHTAALF
jgi:hypothetical protein